MMNNYVKTIIGLLIAGLFVAVMAVPIVSGMTSETSVHYNEGVPFMLADSEDEETHLIVIDENGLTSDGVVISGDVLPGSYTIIFGEHSIIRYDPADGKVSRGGIPTEGYAQQWGTIRNGNSTETLTLTIVGDLLTWANGEYTGTFEDQWAFISKSGDFRYLVNPYVTTSDRIIGGGVTYSPFDSATVICFDGTIENVEGGIYRSSPNATLDSVDVNTTNITTNLYRIDSIKFTATQDDTSRVATYTYFLAPYEIVYDNPAYVGNVMVLLLDLLPLIAGIGLLTIAVVYFLDKRL